jgi:hypothetical protein
VGVEHRRARRRRRAVLLISAAVAVVLVVAALVVRATILHDRSRAVPVDVAREQFREEVTATPPAATASTTTQATATTAVPTTETAAAPQTPSLPAPGVYRYVTTGSESVDALGGATHDYPAETTITATADGCGVLLRWDALVERRDEWRLCATPAGVELQPVGLQYHEFFGQRDSEDLICDRAVLVVPAATSTTSTTSITPPTPVTQSCMLAEDPWLATWDVLDTGFRSVAGAPIEVWHVRMTVDDDDDHWEHTNIDWYLAADGLPVEVIGAKESRSPSPIGAVVYRETYRLALESMTPLT